MYTKYVHYTREQADVRCTQFNTLFWVEILRYTLNTIVTFFSTAVVVHKVEDGKFSEIQQVKLSEVLPLKLRDVVLSCVVFGESHEHEPKQ